MTSVWDDLERTLGDCDEDAISHDLLIERVLPRFADRLAQHGDIAKAARSLGLSHSDGVKLYRRICADLGRQAV